MNQIAASRSSLKVKWDKRVTETMHLKIRLINQTVLELDIIEQDFPTSFKILIAKFLIALYPTVKLIDRDIKTLSVRQIICDIITFVVYIKQPIKMDSTNSKILY